MTSGRLNGKGGLSAQTVKHHHRILSEALNHAVKWGLVFVTLLKQLIARPVKKEMATMQAEEITPFLEEARKMEAASSIPYYTIFYTALHTGMRRGELLALRWCDVELELMTISVNRIIADFKRWDKGNSRTKNSQSQTLNRYDTFFGINFTRP